MKKTVYMGTWLSCLLLTACQNNEPEKQTTAVEQASEQQAAKTDNSQTESISVQLWSIKDEVKANFKDTLAKVADMGFAGVEFAGDYGPYQNDPQGLKAYLDSLNLAVSGAHVGIDALRGEQLNKTLEYIKALDTKLVIIPYDQRAAEAENIDAFVNELTELSNKVSAQGMTLCYHNHAREFDAYQDSTYWDYIAQNTPQEMCLQLDAGWVNRAGKSAIEYVNKYPGRTLTTHIKVRTADNSGKNTIIGQDNYDWNAYVHAAKLTGGTEWFVVEQEEYPSGFSPMQSIEASQKGFSKAYNMDDWVALFDGKTLNNWIPKIAGSEVGVNAKDTFQVKDGKLIVSYENYDEFNGEFGVLFYNQPFSDYILRSTYRFVGEQLPKGPDWAYRNSGFMLHSQSPESMEVGEGLPASIEVQILAGNGVDERSTANICTPETHVIIDDKLVKDHCISSTSKTYHGDQWVTAELEVRHNQSIIHRINSEVVFEYNGGQVDETAPQALFDFYGGKEIKSGYIAVQSETHPVEFKNIDIKVLPENTTR